MRSRPVLTGLLLSLIVSSASRPAPSPQLTTPFGLSVTVVSNADESDIRPFVQSMYKAIRQKALETLPKSVAHGEQGTVTVQLKLQKNGKLLVLPQIISGSGKDELDHHAVSAIRGAVPFDHLPSSAPVPFVLRFTFYYNTPPPEVSVRPVS